MKNDLYAFEHKKVMRWLDKAQIDYSQQYVLLYIAYNAWYQSITGTTNERKAHTLLKSRHIIWESYERGWGMNELIPVMRALVESTQREPFVSNRVWDGELSDMYDWQGLIELWYQVRCRIVHGGEVSNEIARMAYESLYIFMQAAIEKDAPTPLLTP